MLHERYHSTPSTTIHTAHQYTMKLDTHCSTVCTTVQHAPHHGASIAPQHTSAKVYPTPRYAAQCNMVRTALTHKRHSYDKGQRLLLSLTSRSWEGALPQDVSDHSRGLMTLTSHKPSTADTQSGHSLDTVLSALSTKGLSQAGLKFLEAAQAMMLRKYFFPSATQVSLISQVLGLSL